MKKLKTMPRIANEIIITIISFVVLYILWYFFVGEYIAIPDQGISKIGIALSTSIGVLTAIVVSFALIIWQTSRRDRSESFLRWRTTLHQFFEFFDANLEKLTEYSKEVIAFMYEASEVASMSPMSLDRYRKLTSKISDKLTEEAEQYQNIQNPSDEQLKRAKARKYLGDYLVMLTHANFDHNVTHNLYKGLLDLRALLYRLLSLLIACIVVLAMVETTISTEISDIFNAPLALILVAWAIYLLVLLGIEIKRFTRLEDEFQRLESEAKAKYQEQKNK